MLGCRTISTRNINQSSRFDTESVRISKSCERLLRAFLRFRLFFVLTRDYHKFESQNYGTYQWRYRVAVTFITVARVRWRSPRATDRSRAGRTCLCRVGRAFGREMATPERCTTSRAHDHATWTDWRRACQCRDISATTSSNCLISFWVCVGLHATVWCWSLHNFEWNEAFEPEKEKQKS